MYLDYQYGNKQTSGAQLIFERPILPWRRYGPKFSASLFQYGADAPWSQFHQIDRGLAADLTFRKGQVLQHTFRYRLLHYQDLLILPSCRFRFLMVHFNLFVGGKQYGEKFNVAI